MLPGEYLEPVTHFLTGACMSRAGFNRKTALATLTMVLAAEAADLDVLWALKGPIAGLQHHRGITHTFVGAPFVAAATSGFIYLLYRWRGPSGKPRILRSKLPVRWGYLYWLALHRRTRVTSCSTTPRPTASACLRHLIGAGTRGTSSSSSSR